MADRSNAVRAKRHEELWHGSSRTLGRLVVGTLIFAAVVLFNVLVPYTNNLDGLAQARADAATAHAKLESVEARLARANQATETVARVSRTIDGELWRDERAALQASIASLVEDTKMLRAVAPEHLKAMWRLSHEVHLPDDPRRDTRQLPPQDRGVERAAALGRAEVSDRTVALLREMSLPALLELHQFESRVFERVIADRERGTEPDASALRERGLSEEAVSLLTKLPTAELHELRRAPLRLLQQEKIQNDRSVLEAADRLKIRRDDLGRLRDGENWKALVDARLREAARAEARTSIERMTARTQKSVIAPLQSVLREEAVELPGTDELERSVDDLDRTLSEWVSRYAQRDDWYATVAGKASAFEALGEGLRAYRDRCQAVTHAILDRLNAEKEAVDTERKQTEDKVAAIEKEMAEIDEALQGALPAWLRGLITIDHAIQLFSFGVLALLLLGCWYAARTRRHFLVVREQLRADGVDDTEPAMSTIWTLVYRQPLGTFVTIAAYALAVGAAWYFIARGSEQVRRWRTHDLDAVIGLAADGASLLAWLGPLLCISAFAITLTVLFKDYRARRQAARAARAEP